MKPSLRRDARGGRSRAERLCDGVESLRERLPGKRVELKPGGYHIMLIGLTRALAAGETVPLTIVFEEPHGKRRTLEVKAEVRPLGK